MTSTQPEATLPIVGGIAASLAARVRARAPFATLLLATAVLYLWGLSRSGYGNEFYAAAVKAGTQSWQAFLFGSLDPSNFITVDKPPASLWVMELSGRLFGFSSWSMLAPQALEGVAAVALVHATVKRWFSPSAAYLSAAILALTPVAALMFRFNNPDALLVLLLVLAAYATTRSIEGSGARWLALAGAAVGLGFLTKMMAAFLVVPGLALAFLLAAPGSPLRRLSQLAVGGLALVASAGWWVAVVELTPASSRPYVGGSTDNSILDLIWGYNGVGRLDGSGTGQGANFSGTPGLFRLFNSEFGGQITWLLPAALIALAAALVVAAKRPRTDRLRAAAVLWGGWLVVTGLVFSYMGGVIHPYYGNALAPPIAVLVGVVGASLWERRDRLWSALTLAAMTIATAGWAYVLLDRTPSWHPRLRVVVLAAGLGAAVALVAAGELKARPTAAAIAAALLLAGLAAPVAYTLSTVASPHSGAIVAAGPTSPAGRGGPGGLSGTSGTSSSLATLLEQGSVGYRWVAATDSSTTAAPLELATGKAVMALGGFNGSDRAVTLAQFKALVAAGEIHYYVVGNGGGGFGGPGGRRGNSEIVSWVESTFSSSTVGGTTVYDLTSPSG